MSEAFSLAGAYGVEPQTLLEVLVEGLFSAPAYKVYGEIIVSEDFDRVGFTTELALKDVNLVLAAAGDARMPMPSANLLRDRLLGAIAHGDAERDWAVLAREQERASGRHSLRGKRDLAARDHGTRSRGFLRAHTPEGVRFAAAQAAPVARSRLRTSLVSSRVRDRARSASRSA